MPSSAESHEGGHITRTSRMRKSTGTAKSTQVVDELRDLMITRRNHPSATTDDWLRAYGLDEAGDEFFLFGHGVGPLNRRGALPGGRIVVGVILI